MKDKKAVVNGLIYALLIGIGQLPIKQTASSMTPTKEENALMEALAMGLPCISTNVDGVDDRSSVSGTAACSGRIISVYFQEDCQKVSHS